MTLPLCAVWNIVCARWLKSSVLTQVSQKPTSNSLELLLTTRLYAAVIGSALDLIIQQLNDLDVDLTTEELPKQDGMPSMVPHGTPDPPPAPLDWTAALDENAENALEHFPFGDPVNPDDFTIDPAVFESIFETMASIEPLDIRVGAIENAQSENS